MLEDKFKDHPIHATLAELLSRLRSGPLREEMSEEHQNIQSNLTRAAVRLHFLLANADPALVSEATLSSPLQANLQPAIGYLDNYKSGANAGGLEHALNHVNAALPAFPQIGPRLDVEDQEKLAEITQALKRNGDAIVTKAKEQLSELASTQEAIQTKIETSQTELQSLKTQVAELKTRADDVIAQIQRTAQEREDNRTDAFNTLREGFKEQQATQVKAAEEKTKDLAVSLEAASAATKDKLIASAEDVETELAEILKKSKHLFELIGDTAITGKFSNAAKIHAGAANRYRWAAITFFILASGLVIWLVHQISQVGWPTYVARFSASLMLLLPAFYAIKESAKHRDAANRIQRIELELAALEPFISGLDEAKQKEIKANLTPKYFGLEHGAIESGKDSVPLPVNRLIDIISDAVKKK